MDLQPDTILYERYRIIEKLGQGGMGAVYLAWDEILETQVAVKSNFSPAPESVDQFLREAQLLAALHHQNLPRVTDYFVIGKEQYLVMDYIPGEDLGQRLKVEGVQEIQDVLSWGAQLCDALEYMHHQDPPVVHRDIKPANIKLTPDGEVILVDFGIAKASSGQAQTATGAAGYTPGYAPPEQYGQGRTGPYSDQFSLAATLYALLTHVKPADSIQRVLGKENLIPLQELNPQVPPNVGDAVLKAMSLKPEDRFSSVAAFQKAFQDPEFRLEQAVRDQITSPVTRTEIDPTLVGDQATLVEHAGSKRRNLGLILGLGGGGIVICFLVAAAFIFLLPRLSFGFLGKDQATPTPSEMPLLTFTWTVEVIAEEKTQPATPTVTNEPTHPPGVTPTETQQPSPTATPELLGASGVLAFVSDRGEDGILQIWTMRVVRDETGEIHSEIPVQLTFDAGNKDQPVWSPDGTQIVYVAPGGEGYGLDLWVMNADGSDQRNITNHPGDEFDPVWAPDGSLIAFTHHVRDIGDAPIYALTLIRPDGTERVKLSLEFVEYDPTFSPDMEWMLYVISAQSHDYFYFRGAYDGYQSPRGFDLRAIFGEFGQVSDPAWAPVGDQFAYTRRDGAKQNIILVAYESVQRNGLHHPKEYVLTDTNAEFDPAWSPDARWIAFTSTRDEGDFDIYLMTTTGRPQVNLTNRLGIDRSPDWKPLLSD